MSGYFTFLFRVWRLSFQGSAKFYAWMILFLVVMGLLAGGYHPSAPPLISADGTIPGNEGGPGNVFEIDDLVVNPAESGGLRYVAASVSLRSARPAFVEEMATHEAPIKDALIRILGSKTVEELADIKAREAMREEILSEVDRLIPEQQIDAVYFTRFVLQ